MLVCFLNCAAVTKTYRLDLPHRHTHTHTHTHTTLSAPFKPEQQHYNCSEGLITSQKPSWPAATAASASKEGLVSLGGRGRAAYSLDRVGKREREIESWKRTQRGGGGSRGGGGFNGR